MDDVSFEADMDDVYALSINSEEMCRNCLARNCQLKSLFRCDIIDGEICPLPKVYQSVTNIAIVENDIFPKNICTKCESALFEAFIFKQKSTKSHRLLQKILNAIDDTDYEYENSGSDPLMIERKSRSTQTQSCTEENRENNSTLLPLTNEKRNIKEYKIEFESAEILAADVFEEHLDENWQLVCEARVQSKDNSIDESVDAIDDFEFVESLPQEDEMSSQSNEISSKIVIGCEQCGEVIKKRQLQNHLKQHSKILPYILNSTDFFRCNRCQMVFLSIDRLSEHLNDDNGCVELLLDKDDLCTDYQYLNNDLPIRLLSATRNFDENTFSCGQCILDFNDLAMFRSHIEENHSTDYDCSPEYLRADSAHLCGNCSNSFKTLRDTIQHMYYSHQSIFKCLHDDCTQSFGSFIGLYAHFTKEHPELVIECSHCRMYVATDNEDLKMHQRETCMARNFKCEICDKTFYKKSTLKMHVRSHTNDRKYPCTFCSKSFLQSNDLSNHIRTHTLERPFKCLLCHKSFKTVGQRIGHMSTHSTEQNFQCDICQKNFKSARILRGHKKIHGERQFNCGICEKKFNRRYHLTLHMKRHEKPTKKRKTTKN